MRQEEKNFLLQEYKEAEVSPKYVRLNGKEYLIPMDYFADYQDFQKAFIHDFFDVMRQDYELYKQNGEPVQYVTFPDEDKSLRLVVPYDWRMQNRSKEEIAARIFLRADKKYDHVMAYTLNLQNAVGKKLLPSYVTSENLRDLKREMAAQGLEKNVSQKLRHILQSAVKKTKNNPKWSVENLRLNAQKWFVRVSLAASLSGLGYGVFQAQKADDSKATSQTQQLMTDDAFAQKTSVVEKKRGAVNSVVKHNKKLFDQSLNDMICYIAFVEDYKKKAYNDKKNVPTVGYGTTYYLNENGQKTRKVKYGDTLTVNEAAMQTERYLKHVVWPLIEKSVKVKLDHERLITTAQFAYLLSPKSFETSAYLDGLNRDFRGLKLANLMTEYSKDKGVSKRCLPAVYMMEGRLQVKDLLHMHAASVYNCPYDLVVMCKKNGKRIKDRNHIGRFKTDEESANRVMKIFASSYHGKLNQTKSILPSQIVQAVNRKETSKLTAYNVVAR